MVSYQDATPATEKYETTEVIKIKTLKFHWESEEQVVEKRKTLSKVVKTFKKKDEWKLDKKEKIELTDMCTLLRVDSYTVKTNVVWTHPITCFELDQKPFEELKEYIDEAIKNNKKEAQ